MKILTTLLLMVLFISCGSVTSSSTNVKYQEFQSKNLIGLTPIQMRKILGKPVFEGFNEGVKGGPLVTIEYGKGLFYSMVYPAHLNRSSDYRVSEVKECYIVRFYENDQFEFQGHIGGVVEAFGNYCSINKLQFFYEITPRPLKEFWTNQIVNN